MIHRLCLGTVSCGSFDGADLAPMKREPDQNPRKTGLTVALLKLLKVFIVRFFAINVKDRTETGVAPARKP
jgi:hypothetical protein